MKTGVVGRADLLEAYLAGGPELQSAVARLLGMELVIPEPIAVPPEIRPAAAIPIPEPSPPAVAVASIPFLAQRRIRGLNRPMRMAKPNEWNSPRPTNRPRIDHHQPRSPFVRSPPLRPFSPNCGASPPSRERAGNSTWRGSSTISVGAVFPAPCRGARERPGDSRSTSYSTNTNT